MLAIITFNKQNNLLLNFKQTKSKAKTLKERIKQDFMQEPCNYDKQCDVCQRTLVAIDNMIRIKSQREFNCGLTVV